MSYGLLSGKIKPSQRIAYMSRETVYDMVTGFIVIQFFLFSSCRFFRKLSPEAFTVILCWCPKSQPPADLDMKTRHFHVLRL